MRTAHTTIKSIFLFSLLSLFFVSTVYAGTIFVGTNGDNSKGDGSSGKPWRTISYALTEAKYGDTISINNGTYTEGQLKVPAGVSLTSTSRDNTKVKLQPNVSLGTYSPFILLSSSAGSKGDQTISHLEINGVNGSKVARIAISVQSRDNVRIHHCNIHHFYGVYAAAAVEAVSVVSHNIKGFESLVPSDPGPDGDDSNWLSLWPSNPVKNFEFDNNTVTDCGWYGTDRTGSVMLFHVKDSSIHHNAFSNLVSRGEFISGRGYGMSRPGKTAMLNNVDVYNNDFAIGEPYGSVEDTWAIEVWVMINGCEFYNNTSSGPYGSSFYSITIGKNTSIYNNVLSISPPATSKGIGIEFNVQSYSKVYNNFIENSKWGIICGHTFSPGQQTTRNVTIRNNTIYNSKHESIWVACEGAQTTGSSAAVNTFDIYDNFIVSDTARGSYGIKVSETFYASPCSLSNVNITTNIITGMNDAAGKTSGSVSGLVIDSNNFYKNNSNEWVGSTATNTMTYDRGLPIPPEKSIAEGSTLSPPTLSITAN